MPNPVAAQNSGAQRAFTNDHRAPHQDGSLHAMQVKCPAYLGISDVHLRNSALTCP